MKQNIMKIGPPLMLDGAYSRKDVLDHVKAVSSELLNSVPDKAGNPVWCHAFTICGDLEKGLHDFQFTPEEYLLEAQMVALLHDVLEDLPGMDEYLLASILGSYITWFFPGVIPNLKVLTRNKVQNYKQYILECAFYSHVTREIKLMDVRHHIEFAVVGGEQVISDSLLERYKWAVSILEHARKYEPVNDRVLR